MMQTDQENIAAQIQYKSEEKNLSFFFMADLMR